MGESQSSMVGAKHLRPSPILGSWSLLVAVLLRKKNLVNLKATPNKHAMCGPPWASTPSKYHEEFNPKCGAYGVGHVRHLKKYKLSNHASPCIQPQGALPPELLLRVSPPRTSHPQPAATPRPTGSGGSRLPMVFQVCAHTRGNVVEKVLVAPGRSIMTERLFRMFRP